MASIGTVSVRLVAYTQDFSNGLNKAASKMKAFSSGLEGSTSKIGSAFGFLRNNFLQLGALFGVTLGAGAFIGLTKEAFNAVDAMDELSSKTGLTVEKLQALQYAAKFSGVSSEQLTTAIMKMQKTLVSGSKMFDAAGMDVGKLLGMDADQQIGAIADRLATMTNATERTAFATAMFGKAGAHLLPFLEGGSEGLAQLEQELQATGNAYSSMDASKVAIAADAIDRLKTTVSALFQQVAIQLSPAILDITNRFVEWANSGEGMGAKVKYGIDIVIQSAGGLMNAFQGVGTVFGWIGEMITGGLSHVNTNIEGVSNSTISLGTVFLSFGALINDVLGKVAGAFGYMFARIKTGMDVVILGVLMGVDKLVNAVQTAANKVIGLNNTVMRMAGNEAGVVDLFNTNDNGLDPFIKDMQEKTKKGFDEIGNVGPWEKYFQDNSKMLNGEIDKISEAQKPSSQLDQWWATVNSKMDEQAAQHENITQMEEEGLDLEKLKTKEKEKQEKIEQGGFLVSKFGRTAFGADSTFDKEGNKLFGNTAKEGSPGKDGQIVTELQEQTNYLRVLASKPQVASFA